jgi:outer membrane protein OmpA-like peptidoglycan-associated protein
MTDEFGFNLGPNGNHDNRLEELLDRLELQETGYESATVGEWETSSCPRPVSETVSQFSRYDNSVAILPPADKAKLGRIAGLIQASLRAGCPTIFVRLVGYADRDLQKERQQPGFLMKISGQRATAVRAGLESLINDPALTSRINWNVSGAGANELVAPVGSPLNRRVKIFLESGIAPVPITIVKDFRIATKSYINTILPRIGLLFCPLPSPSTEAKLAAFAGATQSAVNENPSTDIKDRNYRLFSECTFSVTCGDNGLVDVKQSPISTDHGLECIPRTTTCLSPPPLRVFDVTSSRSGPNIFDFTWSVKGQPHPAAEPGFQAVCPRTSKFIWHAVRGRITCGPSGPTMTAQLSGSQFPSHRVWINGALISTRPQGNFSQLWSPFPGDAFRVA